MSKVLILQPLVPQYRFGVYKSLLSRKDADCTIVAGSLDSDLIKTVSDCQLKEIRSVYAAVLSMRLRKVRIFLQPKALLIVLKLAPDCTILHGNIYDLTSWVLLVYGRVFRRPMVLWTIGLQKRESGLKWLIRKLFFSLSSGLLLYGEYPKKLLMEKGFPEDQMYVIFNSLDTAKQAECAKLVDIDSLIRLRQSLGINETDKVLLFIGRIVPRKRLEIILNAMSILVKENNSLHFIFLGDGEDKINLETIAEKRGLRENVHFVGAVYDELLIAKYMALASGSVVPEAGLPIIHPMAYGVPPIISNDIERHGTEWEAVVEGKTGVFFKDGNVNSLVHNIRYLLAHDEFLRQLSVNCRQLAIERYSSESHADRILEGVRRLLV